MSASARLDDAHGWKRRKRSASLSSFPGGGWWVRSACCWVLREQAPLLCGAGFVVSCAGCGSLCSYRFFSPVRGWVGCLVGRCGVCGLVGVCELDSGCEHLVVMFCGLFLCVLSELGRTVDALAPRADEGRGRPR